MLLALSQDRPARYVVWMEVDPYRHNNNRQWNCDNPKDPEVVRNHEFLARVRVGVVEELAAEDGLPMVSVPNPWTSLGQHLPQRSKWEERSVWLTQLCASSCFRLTWSWSLFVR